MAAGDVNVQVVESPITAAKVSGAIAACLSNLSAGSGAITVDSFNQGRSVVVSGVEVENP